MTNEQEAENALGSEKTDSSDDSCSDTESEESQAKYPRRFPSYEPLRDSEIRLIQLKRCPDNSVDYSLHHASLNARPFIALSYEWGDPTEAEPIVLGGHPVDVPGNLRDALQQLGMWLCDGSLKERMNCEALISDEALFVWADAVCINQSDIEEKSLQIPRMKEIYPRASAVVAWISRVEPDLLDGFSNLPPQGTTMTDMVQEIFNLANSLSPLDEEGKLQGYIETDTLNTVLPEPSAWLAETLESYVLGGTDFFGRLWVVQEMVLAKEEPVIAMGGNCTRLSLLQALFIHFRDRVQSRLTALSLRAAGRFDAYLDLRAWKRQWEKNQTSSVYDMESFTHALNFLLNKISTKFHATLSQDRIYGVLGLAPLPASLPPNLRPDYTKPYGVVYREYTSAIFKHTGKFGLLYTSNTRLRDQPSWVPDLAYSQSLEDKELPLTMGSASFSDDGLKMTVQGVMIGAVKFFFEPLRTPPWNPQSQFREGFASDMKRFAFDFLQEASTCWNREIGSLLDMFLLSIIRSIGYKESELPEWRAFLSDVLEDRYQPPTTAGITGLDFKAPVLFSYINKYAFFFLEDGTFGRVMREDASAACGDVVALLKGMDAPVVLRAREGLGGEYRFWGVCALPELRDVVVDEEFYRKGRLEFMTLV